VKDFDIAPFGLPNCAPGEIRFDDPRDIEAITVRFDKPVTRPVRVEYLRKAWPQFAYEISPGTDLMKPAEWGWCSIDDQFNSKWQRAAAKVSKQDSRTVTITFRPLEKELDDLPLPDMRNLAYRRTLGLRVSCSGGPKVKRFQVHTRSRAAAARLRVELDAGRRTQGKTVSVSGYNARITGLRGLAGVKAKRNSVELGKAKRRIFELGVQHMIPAFRYSHDDGHITMEVGGDAFTISVASLEKEGPVWFAEKGVFVSFANDNTTFADYRKQIAGSKTVAEQVKKRGEQSLAKAMTGQPRPHPIAFVFGFKHCWDKFWLEPWGDVSTSLWPLAYVEGVDVSDLKIKGAGRFRFHQERSIVTGRWNDPFPMLAYNIAFRAGDVAMEQKVFATPLNVSPLKKAPGPRDPLVAMLRFRFTNTGRGEVLAELPLSFAAAAWGGTLPGELPDPIEYRNGWIRTRWKGAMVSRAHCRTSMAARGEGKRVVFSKRLAGGKSCEFVLSVPYRPADDPASRRMVAALDFATAYRQVRTWWQREPLGSEIRTPEPRLNEAYAGHVPIVYMADYEMDGEPDQVNTSVGARCYMNYTNESCMILEDLDQRGLHEEVEKRLAVWVKHQGEKGLLGNFSDHDGVLYAAGGFECGESYNQHHGWALWYLAEHYFVTNNKRWFRDVADSVVKACDWIIRQRALTKEALPHSRGVEKGFLPAGALEDVDDYFYWLSTNCLTWRGLDTAARALADVGRPEAARFAKEASAFRRDLRRGFEVSRRNSPLIRLRDGRWIPHYPSRLYRRGRAYGWIREVLEGSVYLLLSGLYDPKSRKARDILDDFQDTRYMNPPFGFVTSHMDIVRPGIFPALVDPIGEWYNQGGFCFQPNLLAGLLPYLDRDEPEIYIWMFLNAWTSCYREEVNAMVEHPIPQLGFNNAAPLKTSDQSNAMKWLRYMYVYAPESGLYLGRALPREWLNWKHGIAARNVATRFGRVSVEYVPGERNRVLTARARLTARREPPETILRFRHPASKPIRSVKINGKRHTAFDPVKGDVDITGMKGSIVVEARY